MAELSTLMVVFTLISLSTAKVTSNELINIGPVISGDTVCFGCNHQNLSWPKLKRDEVAIWKFTGKFTNYTFVCDLKTYMYKRYVCRGLFLQLYVVQYTDSGVYQLNVCSNSNASSCSGTYSFKLAVVNLCKNVDCGSNGRCTESWILPDVYQDLSCSCSQGYEGKFCETGTDQVRELKYVMPIFVIMLVAFMVGCALILCRKRDYKN